MKPSICGSSRTARCRSAPARRPWARAICPHSSRCWRSGSASPIAMSVSCKATATRCLQALASVASRSIMMAGSATTLACDQAIEKGRRATAHLFEADADDIEVPHGTFQVVGTDRAIPILELAQRMRATAMPDDLSGGLDNVAKFVSPQMSFPNGCHVCEVEIDPETGIVTVLGYTAVDDVGNILNETIVEEQYPTRRGPGPWASAGRAGALRGGRSAGDRILHGLLHAARDRHSGAVRAPSCRSLWDKSARRKGCRRIRCRRRSTVCRQRRARCPGELRHPPSRSADDTSTNWSALHEQTSA